MGAEQEYLIGSGTTLIACEESGFKYIGIEKEKQYIEIIEKRLEYYRNQLKLDI